MAVLATSAFVSAAPMRDSQEMKTAPGTQMQHGHAMNSMMTSAMERHFPREENTMTTDGTARHFPRGEDMRTADGTARHFPREENIMTTDGTARHFPRDMMAADGTMGAKGMMGAEGMSAPSMHARAESTHDMEWDDEKMHGSNHGFDAKK